MKRTTLCYIERDGRWLMLHRTKKKDDGNRGKWIGVGGHIEPGETPEACVLREVREETGLWLTEYRARGVVHFRSDEYEDEDMFLFTATGFDGALRACDEGELAWIDRDAVLALPTWAGDRIFLNLLRAGAPGFELTLEYRGESLARAALDGREIPTFGEAQ